MQKLISPAQIPFVPEKNPGAQKLKPLKKEVKRKINSTVHPEAALSQKYQDQLKKAGYKLIGQSRHAAVKLCHWTKASIKSGETRHCYKQQFYGIKSHMCVQMTPDIPFCNLRCSYCWRDTSKFKKEWKGKTDGPVEIVEEAIKAQRSLLTGLGGVPHSKEHLKDAMEPAHVAISLDGEPTMYPHLAEMIREFTNRKITTFLVTNGTNPEKLEELKNKDALPTQLYHSLSAHSRDLFKKTQHPTAENLWEKIKKTLEIESTLNCRRVIRLTLVKNLNLNNPEKYAELIMRAKPHFVEVKGWSALGSSRNKMSAQQMPQHEEIVEFAKQIEKATEGFYKFSDDKEDSRVALLTAPSLPAPDLYWNIK